MKNDEFLFKIQTIIDYLKEHEGYNYKLYNHTYPDYNQPDSNIVEYAEDIKKYGESLNYNEDLETYIKAEICKIIMDNLKLFSFDDSKLMKLKRYCKSKTDNQIIPTPNELLMDFVHEALLNLLLTDFLYDFRDIE